MRESHVSVNQLVDIALGKPRIGVLDLSSLHSLLHIIVRKLNLENCKVVLPNQSKQIQKFLQSKSPIAINEYSAGKLVERAHSQRDDEPVIKIKHPKKKFARDEHAIVANILDDILNGIHMPQSDDRGICDAIIGNDSSVQLFHAMLGDMIASVIGDADDESEPKKSADSDGESDVDPEQKSKSKSQDGNYSDSIDESDPIVRTSQIGLMVSQILEDKSKKKSPKKNDLFHQFEQLIKNLDCTKSSENCVEFKDFLQQLFDELKTKTENYLHRVQKEREMMEKPMAKDLCFHVETQVSRTLLDENKDEVSIFDEHELRQKLARITKRRKTTPKRLCGGKHTVVQSADRQNPKAIFKEKFIDLAANQMKINLQNQSAAQKPKTGRCCEQPNCTCHNTNTLSAVYGVELI